MHDDKRRVERIRINEDERQSRPAPRYGPSLQENLISVLAYSDEGKKVARVNPDLFEGDYRTFAERIIGYWKKYNKPPKAHTADLFSDVIENPDNRRARTYQRILRSMLQLSESMNTEFVLDQIDEFTKQQLLKDMVLKSAEQLNRGTSSAEAVETLQKELQGLPTQSATILTAPSLSQFPNVPTKWLWHPFIPLCMSTALVGEGKVGKSTLMFDLTARITKGMLWPELGSERPERAPKGSVIILTKEEAAARSVRARLTVAGADLSRVLIPGYGDPTDPNFAPMSRLDQGVDELERLVTEQGDVRLIWIDPVTDYNGKVDPYRDDQVRAFLDPLNRIASKHELAIVYILHVNKNREQDARNRGLGSVAFRNVPRSVLFFTKSPQFPEAERILVLEASNFVRTPRAVSLTLDTPSGATVPRVEWGAEEHDVNIDALLSPPKEPTKQQKAAQLIQFWLKDGPLSKIEIEDLAGKEGISWPTVILAKKALKQRGILDNYKSKGDRGRWYWKLSRE